jgi:hypothetical protein
MAKKNLMVDSGKKELDQELFEAWATGNSKRRILSM